MTSSSTAGASNIDAIIRNYDYEKIALDYFEDEKDNKVSDVKEKVTFERVERDMDELVKLIGFYRNYPDLYIDKIKGPNSTFKFYLFQRVLLRIQMRYRFTYATYPRAYSKSMMTIFSLMLKAIFYPGSQLFVSTGGKEQAASITLAKIEELCRLIPPLQDELNFEKGQTKRNKQDLKYVFKNNSSIDVLVANDHSRGQRRTGGVIEEAILIDGNVLNDVLIPTTNIDRLLPNGERVTEEIVNKSMNFITTAGWRGTFPYEKLIEYLCFSIIYPELYYVIGGTYRVPIIEGLLPSNFVAQLKLADTFSEASFEREYESKWSGVSEGSYFNSDAFDACRILENAELSRSRGTRGSYYIMSVDVGRFDCPTEVCIFKVAHSANNNLIIQLVNLISLRGMDFEKQSVELKKIYYNYGAETMVLDANGVGAGLVDFLNATQIDSATGEEYCPFGIEGGTNEKVKEQYKNANKKVGIEKDALYLVKANSAINAEVNAYTETQIRNKRIQFLADEREALSSLMEKKEGANMTPEEREKYLMPYVQTSILKEQMMNLVQKQTMTNEIQLDRFLKSIEKDKFSAFGYGLYYIKQKEGSKRNKRIDISKLSFFD